MYAIRSYYALPRAMINAHEGKDMSANSKVVLSKTATVDAAAVEPYPNSRKVYVQGSRTDIRVPMRAISQSDTHSHSGVEKNPTIFVYDTSGPYTDLQAQIDIRRGLPTLRAAWIEERGDSEALPNVSSEYGRARLSDTGLAGVSYNFV